MWCLSPVVRLPLLAPHPPGGTSAPAPCQPDPLLQGSEGPITALTWLSLLDAPAPSTPLPGQQQPHSAHHAPPSSAPSSPLQPSDAADARARTTHLACAVGGTVHVLALLLPRLDAWGVHAPPWQVKVRCMRALTRASHVLGLASACGRCPSAPPVWHKHRSPSSCSWSLHARCRCCPGCWRSACPPPPSPSATCCRRLWQAQPAQRRPMPPTQARPQPCWRPPQHLAPCRCSCWHCWDSALTPQPAQPLRRLIPPPTCPHSPHSPRSSPCSLCPALPGAAGCWRLHAAASTAPRAAMHPAQPRLRHPPPSSPAPSASWHTAWAVPSLQPPPAATRPTRTLSCC